MIVKGETLAGIIQCWTSP